ncbi:MAG: DUF2974 domain-containing protein [Treponema sp.]|jgi:hypothetical protein|nr:DUF2974 domain-containing protein [Treponema sp.]
MANLLDYLKWRGDLSFARVPFNPVDAVILSQLSYFPFDGIVHGVDSEESVLIGTVMETLIHKIDKKTRRNEQKKSIMMFPDDEVLVRALSVSERFKNCGLRGYMNLVDTEKEIQFSAVCLTARNLSYIAYRGTDMTIVGWKEDFSMCFNDVVPAQLEAVKYLEEMSGQIKGPLRIGGHSKGGNLAIYAASHCKEKTRGRITHIYTHDSPGFQRRTIESGGFIKIKNKICSFVPQSSVVGMLLEHGNDYSVIRSNQIGLLQHYLYSWEVTRNDLVYVNKISYASRFMDKTLNDWINGLNANSREQFFDALFNILNATNAKSLTELEGSWFKAAGKMLYSMTLFDETTKKLIKRTLGMLFDAAKYNLTTSVVSKIKNELKK